MAEMKCWEFDAFDNLMAPDGEIVGKRYGRYHLEVGKAYEKQTKSVEDFLRILNAHDGLLGIADATQTVARNICENATDYKKMPIFQLHFFIETATAMLSGLATVADAAIAQAEPKTEGK